MLDYIFGDHLDTTKVGPVEVDGLKLDPEGYSVEAYLTTLNTSSVYAIGKFKNNANDSISFTPNQNFARLVNGGKTYKGKLDHIGPETRLRFMWYYQDGKFGWRINRGIDGWKELGEVDCDDPTFDANWLFIHKTACLSSRVVVRDHTDTITNDFTIVDKQLTDTTGNATVLTDTTQAIQKVHAITEIEGDGKLTIGSTMQFKTSPGFDISKVVLNESFSIPFKEGIEIPLGDFDGFPQLGDVELTAIGKDGTEFTMMAELVAPSDWEVVEYGTVATDETTLTYQVQRHPNKGNVLLYPPTDDVSVDEYNVIHPVKKLIDHKFYVIDDGGMFVVHITPDRELVEPPAGPPFKLHRDFSGFNLGDKVNGETGFNSDAGRATLSDENLFNGKPSVKHNMREGQSEWAWGGVLRTPRKVVKGETIIITFPMAVPKETDILSRDNFNTKWFRCSFRSEDGKKQPYADIYIHNKEGDDRQFAYILEGQNKWHFFGDKNNPKDCIVQDNEFAEFQMVMTLDDVCVDDGGKGRTRFYKDGQLVKGGDITNRPTMLHATNYMDGFYLGTYWNGKVPKDQHIYTADIRIMTVSEADTVDADGFPLLKNLNEAKPSPTPEPEPTPVEPEPEKPVEPEPEEPVEPEPEEPVVEKPIPGKPSNPKPDNPIKFEDTTIRLEVGASVTISRDEDGIELLIRKPK